MTVSGRNVDPANSGPVPEDTNRRTEPGQNSGKHATESIVFFDGVCGFCNQTVNTMMARDRHRRLRFAPLQGTTAQNCLAPEFTRNLNTLVYLSNGRIYTRSSAVVRILWTIGGISAVAAVLLWLIPRPLRNLGYQGFAKVRYRLFGKHESCRLPTAEERGLILE